MRAQGEWRQPDHWIDFTFDKGQAREPVCGVRYEDAEEFCKWLTRRQGGDSLFRLPFADEARKWQPENVHIAAWCSDDKSLVGLTPSTEQELRRKLMALSPTRPPLPQMSSRAFDLNLARARVLDFEYLLDLGLDITLNLARARALDLTFGHALDSGLDFLLASDLAGELAAARDRALRLGKRLGSRETDCAGGVLVVEDREIAGSRRIACVGRHSDCPGAG